VIQVIEKRQREINVTNRMTKTRFNKRHSVHKQNAIRYYAEDATLINEQRLLKNRQLTIQHATKNITSREPLEVSNSDFNETS